MITRHERDALYAECLFGLDGAPPDLSTRELALAYQRRLRLFVQLRDDLGWQADDGRDTFAITAPHDEVGAWLTELRVAAARCVQFEHHALQTVLAGDPAWFDGIEQELAVRESKAVIDQDLETIHACDAILRRLDEHDGRRFRRPRTRSRSAAPEAVIS